MSTRTKRRGLALPTASSESSPSSAARLFSSESPGPFRLVAGGYQFLLASGVPRSARTNRFLKETPKPLWTGPFGERSPAARRWEPGGCEVSV